MLLSSFACSQHLPAQICGQTWHIRGLSCAEIERAQAQASSLRQCAEIVALGVLEADMSGEDIFERLPPSLVEALADAVIEATTAKKN